MAAVDKAIDLGIADPKRLAVAGHSYGGYSTYTLVSYTDRFKAAIAMDGDANLLTSYAKFDADQRYWDNAQERREGATWSETSQGRMGEPPVERPLEIPPQQPLLLPRPHRNAADDHPERHGFRSR